MPNQPKDSPETPISCRYCPKTFETYEDKTKHTEDEHKVYKCQLCKKLFDTVEKYSAHINDQHDGRDREYMACQNCGTLFRSLTQLKTHIESKCGTEKMFTCDECGLKYMTQGTLNTHKLVHRGEMSYACTFCDKRFLNKGQLTVHKRMHTGEKPYKCDQCPKEFAYRESLVTHSSLHTGIKPYLCECCSQRFSCIGNLLKHRRTRANSCGLPQYDRKTKVAPRPSIKNPGTLTMKRQRVTKARKVLKEEDKQKCKRVTQLHYNASVVPNAVESANEKENKTEIIIEPPMFNQNDSFEVVTCNEDLEDENSDDLIECIESIGNEDSTDSKPKIENLDQSINEIKQEENVNLFEILNKEYSTKTTHTSLTTIEFIENGASNDRQHVYQIIEKKIEEDDWVEEKLSDEEADILPIYVEHNELESDENVTETENDSSDKDEYTIVEMLEDEVDNIPQEDKIEKLKNILASKDVLECPWCPKIYQQKKPFITHLQKDHNIISEEFQEILPPLPKSGTLACKFCNKHYSSLTALKKHESRHGPNGELGHKCSMCPEYFASPEEATDHALKEHPNRIYHKICDRINDNQEGPKPNKAKEDDVHHNKISKPTPCICPKCGKKCSSKSVLLDHERSECGSSPQYQCDVCKKFYHSSGSLKTHMTVHTGELPFKCSDCDKAFRTRGQVKVHQRKHNGEKPFKCDRCPKAFAYRESLLVHFSIHTGRLRFLCHNCGARFSCISNLQSHRRIHKNTCGAKPNYTKPIGRIMGVVHGSVYIGDKSNVAETKERE